jgi:IS5 family transposase
LLRDKTRPPGKKPLLEATVRQVVTKTTRAGIEAKHGQAVRRCGLRRCRYIGLAKTHLQHLISAAAINLARIANWVNGIPTAQTRCSWFAALQKVA